LVRDELPDAVARQDQELVRRVQLELVDLRLREDADALIDDGEYDESMTGI